MTGRIEGTVTDSQGAAVAAAQVKVTNNQTGQSFALVTDEKGNWALPSMPSALYRIVVTRQGFKTATIENVKVDAGVPATVKTSLEVGALTETIEVSAGAEVLQTQTATVTDTLVGRQLHELPFTSRNLTELIVTQPGSATPGVPRSTSVYGLPQAAMNVTIDGINIQDNSNKSSDGFFNAIFPRADAIEEMTVSSASAGADSNAEGAYQVKMVTRSGTNDWHGGLFEQHRNQDLNANYYFNNINSQPRDHMVFNQFGGQVGGPIKHNKLFFFAHYEDFRLPQTYTEPTGTVLTPSAIAGNFTYSANGTLHTVNLYSLAAAGGFPSTPDPILIKSLQQIDTLVEGQPGLKSRIASNSDYNRNNLDFQSKGGNYRRFPTIKFDYNLNQKNHLEFVYYYQTNLRSPDGVNIGTASPIFPGTGNVLNSANGVYGNQGGIAFQAVTAWRSTLTPNLTSEVRFGLNGGTVIFNNGISAADFGQWRGYAPIFGSSTSALYATDPYRTTGQSRRNTPLKQGNANLTWSHGEHLLNFGFSFTQVNSWTTATTGAPFVPSVAFAVAANDPVNTGGTSLFTTGNFPSATSTNLSDAASLYALLTGRVASITNSVVEDEKSKQYGVYQPIVRNQQREFGLYFQDAWRLSSRLTLNYGVRWDRQDPPVNLNGVYTRPGYAGVWGISGVGNLFAPGTMTGTAPALNSVPAGTPGYNTLNHQFSPSVGLAYQVPKTGFKPMAWLLGSSGQSVLRGGYAISTLREDAGTFSIWGGNQGRTLTTSVDPSTTPANFGAPGSVLFRDATLPSRQPTSSTPTFPLAVAAGTSISDFSPNLKTEYVQSWDLGLQRELTRDTVLEVRYIGNHGTDLWRTINLNEVNIFENGFLQDFNTAVNNLAIANGVTPAQLAMLPTLKSNNFGNQGLPGQQALNLIGTALNTTNDATTALQMARGRAGNLANTIATTAADMNRLTAAGKPANLFLVNPAVLNGASNLVVNGGNSSYQGLQTEVRRRMAKGLLFQGSYTWSHSISNELSAGRGGSYQTLRDVGMDKGPSPYDIRHAFKANWVYELPVGTGHSFLGHLTNPIARKAFEGWEIASVIRIQSGSPIKLQSGRDTVNQNDGGVILHNITAAQLQSEMSIRKTTNTQGLGIVSYLPQSLIDNTLAAFELGGKTLANLDPTAPYIGPANVAGQWGDQVFLYGPWQQKWDFSLVKKTRIREKANVEFRAQALNAFNLTNFLLFVPGNGITPTLTVGSGFGQTTGAYRDLSNTNDPGGRIIEFSLRFNF
jgi:hypothetical protein